MSTTSDEEDEKGQLLNDVSHCSSSRLTRSSSTFFPDESIALNPAPKVGSEINFISGKKERKDSLKKVLFKNEQTHHSIIRELLEHHESSSTDEEAEVTRQQELQQEPFTFTDVEIIENDLNSVKLLPPPDPEVYKAKVKVLSEWNNITNMDQFLGLVYEYYVFRGYSTLILHEISNLIKLGFMIIFATFLAYGVDWSFLSKPATAESHPKLWEIVSFSIFFQQISLFGFVCMTVFVMFWLVQFFKFWSRYPLYDQVSRFYNHLLDINDSDLGDIVTFGDVCHAITKLHEKNRVVSDLLDARDICNRIMRKDNYMIALYNRDLLNLNEHLPSGLMGVNNNNSQLLTRILEWNISFCLLGYVFEGERSCSIRAAFLKTTQRDQLAEELKKRFQILGIFNLLMIPFIIVFIIVYYLFRYGEELYRNPGTVSGRQYSPWALWTLREFNELEHLFEKRLAASREKADRFIESFPAPKYTAIVKLVSFMAGSIVLVLILVTVYNEDLLMHFELTEGKSIIWYLGLFGAILTISRALIPNPRARYVDKGVLLEEISAHLHHSPETWKSHPESFTVKDELAALLPSRYVLFARELLGLFVNPFILYYSLPKNSVQIVEFFREFSVHVDGLGYVCSFALFDFDRHGDTEMIKGVEVEEQFTVQTGKKNTSAAAAATAARRISIPQNSFLQSRHGKMEKSFLNFKVNNPKWNPTNSSSKRFIETLSSYAEQEQDCGVKRHQDDFKESVYYKDTEEDINEELAASVISILDHYREDH